MVRIDGKLPTLNEYIKAERGNKYAGAKLKKEATELVAWQVLGEDEITEQVNIHIEWHTSRKADHDNITFAKKFILDGLVKGGILKDDNPKHVADFSDRVIHDGEDYCYINFEVVK